MSSDQIEIRLRRAPDDPQINEPAYQKELAVFTGVLRENKVKYSQRGMVFDSVEGGGFPLGDFIVSLATVAVGALSTACVAWLKGRSGRKVRLKVGDVEAEAQTIQELDALLKRAAEFRGDKEKDEDT